MAERWDPPVFDKELILKYDKPGPRYTSYPTAPYFHEGFGVEAYIEEIRRTNEAEAPPPLSLYFHLPFCKSVCYFCGCNVHFTKDRTLGDVYVDHCLKEMETLSGLVRPGRKVLQIHWGGGTPTFIPAKTLRRLFEGIRRHFDLAAGRRNRRGTRSARSHRGPPGPLRRVRLQPDLHGHPGFRPARSRRPSTASSPRSSPTAPEALP